jgi:hypothetical protein
VVVALDERARTFDVLLGALEGAERPEPGTGRSLRDALEAAGEDVPGFAFEPERLEEDLAAWAEALRRHGDGALS